MMNTYRRSNNNHLFSTRIQIQPKPQSRHDINDLTCEHWRYTSAQSNRSELPCTQQTAPESLKPHVMAQSPQGICTSHRTVRYFRLYRFLSTRNTTTTLYMFYVYKFIYLFKLHSALSSIDFIQALSENLVKWWAYIQLFRIHANLYKSSNWYIGTGEKSIEILQKFTLLIGVCILEAAYCVTHLIFLTAIWRWSQQNKHPPAYTPSAQHATWVLHQNKNDCISQYTYVCKGNIVSAICLVSIQCCAFVFTQEINNVTVANMDGHYSLASYQQIIIWKNGCAFIIEHLQCSLLYSVRSCFYSEDSIVYLSFVYKDIPTYICMLHLYAALSRNSSCG